MASRPSRGSSVPSPSRLSDACTWVAANQAEIEACLRVNGCILFRGFPLEGADDFDAFVSSFRGWSDLSYRDSLSFAVRTRRSNRICTTNEGKSGGLGSGCVPSFPRSLLGTDLGSMKEYYLTIRSFMVF